MKILIIQERGRHEKNWQFRESLCIQKGLKNLGYTSTVWGLNYENFNVPFKELEETHDVILLVENYPDNWLPDLSNSKKLKIFWSIDSHCILNQHINLCEKYKIDIVLNAVFGHDEFFKKFKTFYFPNAYCDNLIYPKNIEKSIDIGFCGNINNRIHWLLEIKKYFNFKLDEFVIGNEMVDAINSYKIHFNRNIADDLNYRTFETLGCNTFLLTNKTPGFNQLFIDGMHLVTYANEFDLIEKINFFLQNEKERNLISNQGYNHVKKHHTYEKRMEYLIEILKENF
jgi:hypothetical protein